MKLFLLFFTTFISFAQNPSDESFEDRLARINQKFNQSEISEEEWAQVAGEKTAESYSLQEGDTLWDISEKFFGNGYYWPKIWQLNDDITNPHIVKVGATLKFSSGSMATPPQLEVEGSEPAMNMGENTDDATDTEEIAVQSEESPEEVVKSEIIIPKGRKQMEPLETIPSSLPEWRESLTQYDKDDFDDENKLTSKNYQLKSYVSEFISDGPWKQNGKVSLMADKDKKLATTNQDVYVVLEQDAVPAEVYTVFKNGSEIRDPDTKKEVGSQIIVKGLITIKKSISKQEGLFAARVDKIINPIEVGDSILAGNYLLAADYESTGTPSVINAKIIDGDGINRKVFGLHNIVFINKGEKDGLQLDAILDVVKKFNSEVIGKIKVINLAQNVATAVVIRSTDAIRTGYETAMNQEPTDASDESEFQSAPDISAPEEQPAEEF